MTTELAATLDQHEQIIVDGRLVADLVDDWTGPRTAAQIAATLTAPELRAIADLLDQQHHDEVLPPSLRSVASDERCEICNDCPHLSWSGVDQAPLDDDAKLWRCDECDTIRCGRHTDDEVRLCQQPRCVLRGQRHTGQPHRPA